MPVMSFIGVVSACIERRQLHVYVTYVKLDFTLPAPIIYYHHSLIVFTWNYSYNGRASTPDCWKVDPLGAFTPECDRALQEAQAARERGLHLRQETADLIDKCDKLKKSVAKSVNDGITQKMGETTSLKVRVTFSIDHMTKKEKNVFSFAYCHLACFLLSRWFLSRLANIICRMHVRTTA